MTWQNALSDRSSRELWPVGRTAEALGATVRTLAALLHRMAETRQVLHALDNHPGATHE